MTGKVITMSQIFDSDMPKIGISAWNWSHKIQQPLECTSEDNLSTPHVSLGVGNVASSDEGKEASEGLQRSATYVSCVQSLCS